jgi:hypothetical protein
MVSPASSSSARVTAAPPATLSAQAQPATDSNTATTPPVTVPATASEAKANQGFMRSRNANAMATFARHVARQFEDLSEVYSSPSGVPKEVLSATQELINLSEGLVTAAEAPKADQAGTGTKTTSAAEAKEPFVPSKVQIQNAKELKQVAINARLPANPLGDIDFAMMNKACLAADHAAVALGMTAKQGDISARVVGTSPTMIELSLQANASSETCRIQPLLSKTTTKSELQREITAGGLLVVDIHRQNGDGFRTHGKSPSKYEKYEKQAFRSVVIVPHDVYGVRLGKSEFPLTDFSYPQAPAQ